jgi:adenylosuccinate lyase
MELSTLTAISPVDGRYHQQVQHLNEYFSEYGLMKYRVQVEIEYLLFLEKKIFIIACKCQKTS